MTAKLHAIPCKQEEEQCPWCHPSYPCHGKRFNLWNCPRVVSYAFLDGEQVHAEGWFIAGVQFRDEIVLEAELDAETP